MIALVLALTCLAGVFIPWAVRNDAADAHLFHGHNTGCHDCSTK